MVFGMNTPNEWLLWGERRTTEVNKKKKYSKKKSNWKKVHISDT